MVAGRWLIYGANGYTGELIAREAAARKMGPILSGRSATAVSPLARELGLEHRIASLDGPAALDAVLDGVSLVMHCAGPFSRTSKPMVDACLRRRAHYLDITGEIVVFERCAARDEEARDAGVMLLPGIGFDVVPTDGVAAHLHSRLPSATHLALAFQVSGGVSRGTATTAVENLHRGGMIRKDGVLTPVPPAWRTRAIDFGRGPRPAVTIPWGDVSTAFHSTGIPNVEVYMAAPTALRVMLRAARVMLPLFRTGPVQRLLKSRIEAGDRGPSAEARQAGWSRVWGEARDGSRTVVSRLAAPEGYALTVKTALAGVEKVLAGGAKPGYQTPSRAFGEGFILEIPGTSLSDE